MPLKSTQSVLPQTPKLESGAVTESAAEFDLVNPAAASRRPELLRKALLLGAVAGGILCVATLVLAIATGRFNDNSAQTLVQGTTLGYLTGCLALYSLRFEAEPPTGLRVDDSGLRFTWRSGRSSTLTWKQMASQSDLYDLRGSTMFPEGARLQLVDDPLYGTFRVATLQAPRAPRIYLSPEAFDAILKGASRAGLRATQYGQKVVMERPNTMSGF